MKLKLKVSKGTKKALTTKAMTMNMSRNDYVLSRYQEHLGKNSDIWQGKVEAYIKKYTRRAELLNEFLYDQRKDKDTPHSEKVDAIRNFYTKHKIYLHVQSQNAQQENVIIRLSEDEFYSLQMLADQDQMSLENYAEKILQYFK